METYFSSIREPVKQLLNTLMSDDRYREEVTYRKFVSSSFDSALKRNVDVYENTPLVGVRMRHNKNSVKVATSPVEVGDLLLLFRGEGFPIGTSLKDLVKDAAGIELGVKAIDPVFDLAVSVTMVGAK